MPTVLPDVLQDLLDQGLDVDGSQLLTSSLDFGEEWWAQQLVQYKGFGRKIWRNNELDYAASFTASGGPTRRDALRALYYAAAERWIEMGGVPLLTLAHWNWGMDNAVADGGALTVAQRNALRAWDWEGPGGTIESAADFGSGNTGHASSVGCLVNIAVFADSSELGRGGVSNTFVEGLYNWLIADIADIMANAPAGTMWQPMNGPENTFGLNKYHDFGSNSPYDLSATVITSPATVAINAELAAGNVLGGTAVTVPTDIATLRARYNAFCDAIDAMRPVGSAPCLRLTTHFYEFATGGGRELKQDPDAVVGVDLIVIGEMNVDARHLGASPYSATPTNRNQQYRVNLEGCTGSITITINGQTATLQAAQTASQWDTAIEALSTVGAGNITVGNYNNLRLGVDGSNDWPRTIRFEGVFANTPIVATFNTSGISAGTPEIYEQARGGDPSRARQLTRLYKRARTLGYRVFIFHAEVFSGGIDYSSLGTGASMPFWTRGDAATPGTYLNWIASTGRRASDRVGNRFLEDDCHDVMMTEARNSQQGVFW